MAASSHRARRRRVRARPRCGLQQRRRRLGHEGPGLDREREHHDRARSASDFNQALRRGRAAGRRQHHRRRRGRDRQPRPGRRARTGLGLRHRVRHLRPAGRPRRRGEPRTVAGHRVDRHRRPEDVDPHAPRRRHLQRRHAVRRRRDRRAVRRGSRTRPPSCVCAAEVALIDSRHGRRSGRPSCSRSTEPNAFFISSLTDAIGLDRVTRPPRPSGAPTTAATPSAPGRSSSRATNRSCSRRTRTTGARTPRAGRSPTSTRSRSSRSPSPTSGSSRSQAGDIDLVQVADTGTIIDAIEADAVHGAEDRRRLRR